MEDQSLYLERDKKRQNVEGAGHTEDHHGLGHWRVRVRTRGAWGLVGGCMTGDRPWTLSQTLWVSSSSWGSFIYQREA